MRRSATAVWLLGVFIAVTGPDDAPIAINSDQIVSMRAPRAQAERTVHKDANCIIFLADAKFVAVNETCAVVQSRIDAARREE